MTTVIRFLDVRQLPRLVEQGLLRTIEAVQNLKAPIGISRNPVRFSTCRRCWTIFELYDKLSELYDNTQVLLLSISFILAKDLELSEHAGGVSNVKFCIIFVVVRRLNEISSEKYDNLFNRYQGYLMTLRFGWMQGLDSID
jgi:hypothetical protein